MSPKSLSRFVAHADPDAARALLVRHAKLVRGLVRRRLGDDSEVEDVAQQTFLAALEALPTLRNPEAAASWLGAITMRTTCKLLRKRAFQRSRTELMRIEQLQNACTSVTDRLVERLDAARFMASTDPVDVTAFWLRVAEQRSLSEIARLTHVSLSTAKRRIARAHGAVRARAPVTH